MLMVADPSTQQAAMKKSTFLGVDAACMRRNKPKHAKIIQQMIDSQHQAKYDIKHSKFQKIY